MSPRPAPRRSDASYEYVPEEHRWRTVRRDYADRPYSRRGEHRPERLDPQLIARARARQVRRRVSVLILMLAAAALVGVDLVRNGSEPGASRAGHATASDTPTPSASPTPSFPNTGPGTFDFAGTAGQVLGTAGTLRTFRVAVETGSGVAPDAFAATIDTILGDPRSWIASQSVRFQRVAGTTKGYDFTIYLATPATSESMCREDGLYTDQYTSCRLMSGKVVINLARWLTAIPAYGAPLSTYQEYAINHEVGHQLGHGHEGCPGAGKLAPVMMQQTLGLKDCVANAWPYPDGPTPYTGQPIP
jgi:hypothetical protein